MNHPITPSIELITTIVSNSNFDPFKKVATAEVLEHIITKAAQWGADQELEACCEWLKAKHWIEPEFADELRAARRSKLRSLKEQALEALDRMWNGGSTHTDWELFRRALEQLDD